ncbi:CHY zinc finger protein [Salipaludibacillus aurantiacus]|uniref:Uncharacterized protein, contains Zn-finger domain of CHY type n=1 Tax=Salipaludibacillus aurantiacus TaxID=1601833 RepID=A0A1H9X2J2_9BACI|nr:CHY zinc finger protein [Salipaludibacillus aurantiacus]SES40335.1 Uncharacterized protein, contains Zn-finger domain of CHY type [Salipaludibacillus aurantiacus]
MKIHDVIVKGKVVDAETRCSHYHSERDRIAIKFKCCGTYYPCIHCHHETAGHSVERWPAEEFWQKAVLCGACGTELTIEQYMQSSTHCPACNKSFNPGCQTHHHLYFERPNSIGN